MIVLHCVKTACIFARSYAVAKDPTAAIFRVGTINSPYRWSSPDMHSAANQYTDSTILMHYLHLCWDNKGIRR